MRIQERLQEKPRLASDKHGGRKRQKQQLLLDLDLAPTGTGCRELPLSLLSPKSCGRHAKQSTRWFPLRRKRWKGFQTAAEFIQRKRKNKQMYHKGGHQLENMPDRVDGCREWQGEMSRKAVEM